MKCEYLGRKIYPLAPGQRIALEGILKAWLAFLENKWLMLFAPKTC
jgi:hypothetical protein